MIEQGYLQEAFSTFTAASKSLEAYYQKLQEEVHYLTAVLEETNHRLSAALNRAEEAKDFLDGILQSLGEAIIVLDPQERVIKVNRAAEDLLDSTGALLMGRPLADLDFSIQEKGSDTILVTSRRKFQVICSRSSIRDSEGLIRGYVVLIKDISMIKELEIQRDRNKRLIAMGEMAAKLVHEIRNPLCSIELYASMLAGDLQETRHAELATGISQGIKSLNHVITNMHYFAIPQKPSFRWVDFQNIMNELIFMLRPLFEAKRIDLSKNLNGQTRLWGDGELIKQALLNILLNALEASPEEGAVQLNLKKGEQDGMIIEIKDHGPGIPLEYLERIFDPFFSCKEKGSGLGLSITANIMQAHGGSIKVKSDAEEGACFQLYFPMGDASESKSMGVGEKNSQTSANERIDR
jgi:nitrogen fixation/metabolism regulation signal transduction histidine kinase